MLTVSERLCQLLTGNSGLFAGGEILDGQNIGARLVVSEQNDFAGELVSDLERLLQSETAIAKLNPQALSAKVAGQLERRSVQTIADRSEEGVGEKYPSVHEVGVMSDVLVLDKMGSPVYTTALRDAIRLYVNDKAVVVEQDWEGRILHSERFAMGMPRVVQLRNWVAFRFNARVSLCRRNLIIRDSALVNGKPTLVCQYCGTPLTTETYSVDHIVPRSRGGVSEWENMVACCKDCNSKKGNRTPREAGMRLIKAPDEPSAHDVRFRFRLHIRNPRPEWESYLYWNVALER